MGLCSHPAPRVVAGCEQRAPQVRHSCPPAGVEGGSTRLQDDRLVSLGVVDDVAVHACRLQSVSILLPQRWRRNCLRPGARQPERRPPPLHEATLPPSPANAPGRRNCGRHRQASWFPTNCPPSGTADRCSPCKIAAAGVARRLETARRGQPPRKTIHKIKINCDLK